MKMTDEARFADLDEVDRDILQEIWKKKAVLLDEIQRLKEDIREVDNEIEQIEETEESRATTRAKQVAIGTKKFNGDAKKGMKYLIEINHVQDTPQDVAEFLFRGENLNKTAIGDYLGDRNDFNLEVLNQFVNLHKFTNKNLDASLRFVSGAHFKLTQDIADKCKRKMIGAGKLRADKSGNGVLIEKKIQFLWSFRLPGEAQKIDRMMEAFAARYCACNPGVFSNTDTCYVLSFAIIMLNTSLHNPSVKDKPSLERFISMNKGINDGADLPNALLASLYESIKKEPFKIPEDDGNDLTAAFFNPDKEGWLLKQGGRYKTWKRRWFILADNCLYYFEFPADKEPKGIIPLENLQVKELADQRKPNCFEIYLPEDALMQTIKAAKTDSEGRVVEGKHTTYRMSAGTYEEKEEWIRCIRKSISNDPYYDMIAERKRRAEKSSNPKPTSHERTRE